MCGYCVVEVDATQLDVSGGFVQDNDQQLEELTKIELLSVSSD